MTLIIFCYCIKLKFTIRMIYRKNTVYSIKNYLALLGFTYPQETLSLTMKRRVKRTGVAAALNYIKHPDLITSVQNAGAVEGQPKQ